MKSTLLAALAFGVFAIGAAIKERPTMARELVCVNAQGVITSGEDWKECHEPRNLWQVALKGW